MDGLMFVTLFNMLKGVFFSVESYNFNQSRIGLFEIYFGKIFEYRVNRTNVSKLRRFVSWMFRVLNWLFLTMMFLGKWEWGRITNNLPMATTLSLIATFIPDDFVNKYYRDNHLARAIILSHFLLSFAMCLIFNINSMREAYPDNPIMFAIAVYIAEGYCTAMVDTIERLIFERTFATANNVLFLCYYSPGVLGSMVYMYFIDPTMTAIDISSSIADLSSMMLRSFTFVTFMIVSYKDLQMLGFDKTVYPQFLKMIGMDKAGELAQKKIE